MLVLAPFHFNGYDNFSLMHDNLLVSEEYVIALADEFKRRNLKITWSCSTRVDNINENKIRLVKESGCNKIYFGIESGSIHMQKLIGKNIKTDTVEQAVRLCDEYGIHTTKSFILGFEEESLDDINDTLTLAIKVSNCKYNQMVQLHYLQPSPGTKVTKNRKHDLILNSEKEISLFLNRSEQLSDPKELQLIKSNAKIFSDFYHIELKLDVDVYKVSFCFSHLLFYYPRTLDIICIKNNYNPIKLFEQIHAQCKECQSCMTSAYDYACGGDGFCKNPMVVLNEVLSLSTLDTYIINFETSCRNDLVKKRGMKL